MMRLTAVGTSGSFAGPDSAASCYLLEWQTERSHAVLLDLGSGALGPLHRYADPDDLDGVVLSHLHPDHCFDIAGLYVHRTYSPWALEAQERTGTRRPPLPVWAPAGAYERLSRANHTDPGLSPQGEPDHSSDLSTAFAFTDMRHGEPFSVAGVQFEPFLVEHPVECYAVRITGPEGEVLVYSGDTDACENLVRAAADADLLLCEAAFEEGRDAIRGIHLTGRRAGETAARAAAGTLLLTHIPPWTRREHVRAEAAAVFTGAVALTHPGDVWEVRPGGARRSLRAHPAPEAALGHPHPGSVGWAPGSSALHNPAEENHTP